MKNDLQNSFSNFFKKRTLPNSIEVVVFEKMMMFRFLTHLLRKVFHNIATVVQYFRSVPTALLKSPQLVSEKTQNAVFFKKQAFEKMSVTSPSDDIFDFFHNQSHLKRQGFHSIATVLPAFRQKCAYGAAKITSVSVRNNTKRSSFSRNRLPGKCPLHPILITFLNFFQPKPSKKIGLSQYSRGAARFQVEVCLQRL